jgi:hypothetical protein
MHDARGAGNAKRRVALRARSLPGTRAFDSALVACPPGGDNCT